MELVTLNDASKARSRMKIDGCAMLVEGAYEAMLAIVEYRASRAQETQSQDSSRLQGMLCHQSLVVQDYLKTRAEQVDPFW
jgi:hypothetical protein